MTNSRIPGFYNLTLHERRAKLADAAQQSPEILLPWTTGGLSAEAAITLSLPRDSLDIPY